MSKPILITAEPFKDSFKLTIPSEYNRFKVRDMVREGVKLFELKPRYRESRKQRGFYHGAICGLFAYFHEKLDHHEPKDIALVHEWLKIELNGEFVVINGKANKIGKTTKGELNEGYIERCIAYLVENYGLEESLLDTAKYKYWRDAVYPHGGADNYIDYLVDIGLLSKRA